MTWQDRAACAGEPTSMFFPGRGGDSARAVATAKAICARCPVQSECFLAGKDEQHGVWGGATVQERGKRQHMSVLARRVHGTTVGYWQHDRYEEHPCQDCRDAKHTADARRYRNPREAPQ